MYQRLSRLMSFNTSALVHTCLTLLIIVMMVILIAQGAEARLAAGDMQKIFALCCVTSFGEVSLTC